MIPKLVLITIGLFGIWSILGVQCNNLYTITFTVSENFPLDREIGNLRDKMEELGLGRGLSGSIFTLMTSEMNHPTVFRINSLSGIVYLNSPLDRESVCPSEPSTCVIVFTVTVAGEDLVFLQVEVTVTDINDQAPRFLLREKRIDLEEGALPGTTIPLPSAEDRDSPRNGIKFYILRPASSRDSRHDDNFYSNYFKLMTNRRTQTGRIVPTLKVIKEIDRESVVQFRFTLVAVDTGGLNGTLPITIQVKDTNDNTPVWHNGGLYRKNIQECSKDSVLFTLEATDADDPTLPNGHVTYRISEQSADYLRINRRFYITGDRLHLSNQGFRGFNKNKVSFIVIASDGRGRSSDATVELILEDCNDHAPEIKVHNRSATVAENSRKENLLSLVVVSDRDRGQNSEFSCHLNDTSLLELVKAAPPMKKTGGGVKTYYKISTKSSVQFDRETTKQYNVIIKCEDHGNPALSSSETFKVTILDENDNSPEFLSSQRPFLIPENAKPSAYVGRVRAWDKDSGLNGMLSYSLDEEGARHFSIGPNGDLHALQSLDRETRDLYRFQVIARDRGSEVRSASASVTVSVQDLNDCAPEFSGEYYFEVVESRGRAAIREVLGKINATDRDLGSNASIEFRVEALPENSQARFHIAWDGSLSVIGVVDRETTSLMHVIVVASDGGHPALSSTTTITLRVLDLNDNAPTFTLPGSTRSYLNVSRDALPNTVLGQLTATDPDEGVNGSVVYSLVGGGASLSRFKLYPDGRLVLTGPLDEFRNPSKLVVKAEDGAEKPLSTVETLEIRYIWGGGPSGSDSQGRGSPPLKRPGRRLTRSLIVFYGLAGLLLIVFFCVCGVLIYLYVRTRGVPEVSRKRSHPATDVVIRRGTLDGTIEKDSKEAMLALSSKTGGDTEASTVCVYNEHNNSYTHLTASLRSPSYTCLPTASETSYGLYGDHQGDRNNDAIYKPWSQQSCNSPGPRRIILGGNKSSTLYSGIGRKCLDQSAQPETMTLKRGAGPPPIKSAHSYAFLDSFVESGGGKKDSSLDCYSTEKIARTRRTTPDGLTTLKSPYVTSSFV